MGCASSQLSVLAYANGFTLWHCKAGSVADASAPGYFNGAADLLASGDLILVSAPDGARALWSSLLGGAVVVAPMG